MVNVRQTVREEWLALTKEEPIYPELPICDPHVHIWRLPDPRYEAAKQAGKEIRPVDSYLPDDLLRDIGSHNIVSTVFEECISMYRNSGPSELQPVGETEFIADQCGRHGKIDVSTGIVGFANLMLGASVRLVIEAHIAAGRNRFRGIREICTWPVNPDLDLNGLKGVVNIPNRLSNEKFREGFACLKKYGLSLDVGLNYTQLLELVDLSMAFPDTTIIVTHCGGPSGIYPYDEKSEEVISEWKHGITELAACPNVFIKLGGLGSRIGRWYDRAAPPGSAELADAMAPYILWCIEKFGVERCMFEGNWPEDKVLFSYNVIWNTLKRIVEKFSANDRLALFHDTAVKAYRLTVT
jgi:L-fuconolactonase